MALHDASSLKNWVLYLFGYALLCYGFELRRVLNKLTVGIHAGLSARSDCGLLAQNCRPLEELHSVSSTARAAGFFNLVSWLEGV